MARKATKTKSRRVYARGALKGESGAAKRKTSRKSASSKIHERLNQIRGTLSAIERKRREEADAAVEFERRLAADPTRLLSLRGLRRVKKADLENIVENENENTENENNAEKERLRSERRLRIKKEIATRKAERNARKRTEKLRRGERKFGLEPANANEIYQTLYDKLIEKGTDPAKAAIDARFYANSKSDPLFRAMQSQKALWGDLLLEAEPIQKPSTKPSIAVAMAIEESVAPLRMRSYASVAAAARKADYRQLALTNLPNVTRAKTSTLTSFRGFCTHPSSSR